MAGDGKALVVFPRNQAAQESSAWRNGQVPMILSFSLLVTSKVIKKVMCDWLAAIESQAKSAKIKIKSDHGGPCL